MLKSKNFQKFYFKYLQTRYYSVISKDILKYSSPNSISNFVHKKVVKFLKERCASLGFISSSRPSFDEQIEEIKLFGDYTKYIDNAVWKVIKDDTPFAEIFLSNEEIFLLVYEILHGYELEKENKILIAMKKQVFDGEFTKIKDIIDFLGKLKEQI